MVVKIVALLRPVVVMKPFKLKSSSSSSTVLAVVVVVSTIVVVMLIAEVGW